MEPPDPNLLNVLAARLAEALGGDGPQAPELGGRATLLRAARDIAHASERQNAPLATYLIGRFVAGRVTAGTDEEAALSEAAAIVDELTAASAGEAGADPPAR